MQGNYDDGGGDDGSCDCYGGGDLDDDDGASLVNLSEVLASSDLSHVVQLKKNCMILL